MLKDLLGLAGFMRWQYELEKKKKKTTDGDEQENTIRLLLNKHFLTERGLDQLYHVLKTKQYRCTRQEQYVMLMLACLKKKGDAESKQMFDDIVKDIEPHFEWIMFYPLPGKNDDLLIHQTDCDPNMVAPCNLKRFKKSYGRRYQEKQNRQTKIIELSVVHFQPLYDELVDLIR